MKFISCILLLLIPMLSQASSPASFAPVYGEHMVLQRDQPLRFHGEAAPGTHIEVRLAGQSARTQAGPDGSWLAEMQALPAGGPWTVELLAGKESVQSLEDVWLGDVYLCSGQSNMEWPVSRSSGADSTLWQASADIRLLTVNKQSAARPQTRHGDPQPWRVADQDSVQAFSAVCWFFARRLRSSESVPLGLVHASWGGSQLEAWVSPATLAEVGGYAEALKLLAAYAEDPAKGSKMFSGKWEDWWTSVDSSQPTPWADEFDESGWTAAPVDLGDWKTWGVPELATHHGMLWYRTRFDVSAAQVAQPATLVLGGIDEVDIAWLNGRFVGTQFGWGTERRYSLPQDYLRTGANNLTVNVLNNWGMGGLLGPTSAVKLEFADGSVAGIAGPWRYQAVASELGRPPQAPWESVSGLAGMYNAMLMPLKGLGFAGALWYQGESNAGRADSYEALLSALISDWRVTFDVPLPFVIMQLPGFGGVPVGPSDSGWARMRDAQRRVAENVPQTGLVVTLDVGDIHDIHPTNKQVVGQRAAAVMLGLVYGKPGIEDGIRPVSAQRKGANVVVGFAGDPLGVRVAGAARPVSFEACDPAGCRYVEARLEAGQAVLEAPVAERVRYCWADAPLCNLVGGSGLPVGSFEISVQP